MFDEDKLSKTLQALVVTCGADSKKWMEKLEKGGISVAYNFILENGIGYKVKINFEVADVEVKIVDRKEGEGVTIH